MLVSFLLPLGSGRLKMLLREVAAVLLCCRAAAGLVMMGTRVQVQVQLRPQEHLQVR